MVQLASPFPDTAYIIRKDRRFRIRDAAGALDQAAVVLAEKLLPTAGGLTPEARAKAMGIIARLRKAAESPGPQSFAGLPVVVEYPVGSTRSGLALDGQPWTQIMTASYGFMLDTMGMDGDELDVFIGPCETSPWAYAIICITGSGPGEWELKLMLGWEKAEEAQGAFLENIPAMYFGGIYQVPVDLIRNLMAAESMEAGLCCKSLRAVAQEDGGLVTMTPGVMVARVTKVATAAPPAPPPAPAPVPPPVVQEAPAPERPAWMSEKVFALLSKKRTVRCMPVAKDAAGAPEGQRLIYGIVLEVEPNQGAGDAHDETYDAETVRNAAHGYLLFHQNMTDSHGRFLSKQEASPVESFLAPIDYQHNGTLVRAGSWVLVTKVFDDALWQRVASGELNAYSIGGYAERGANT